jgi:hypothetical protein
MDATVECDGSGNEAQYQEWLANYGGFTAADNCSDVTYSMDVTPFEGCSMYTGGYDVVFTAEDGCGNTVSSSASFTIEDTTDPVLVGVPDNILDPVECDDVPAPADVTATDGCSSVDLSYNEWNEYESSDSYMCNYSIIREWTATDECGNSSTATQTINVQDSTDPVFDQTVEDVTVECGNVPDPELLTGTDNCTMAEYLLSWSEDVYLDGGCPEGASIERTYYLEDMCGNVAMQVQTITVVDTEDPVFIEVPEDATVDCLSNLPPVSPVLATDNCDDDLIITSSDVVTPNGCNYDVARTWIAVDDCGNSASYTQMIYVVDDVDPEIISGPQDMTVSCADMIPAEDITSIVATDNCSDVTVTVNSVTVGDDCMATVTRTYTVTDACDNAVDHVQTITVVDDVKPTIMMGPEDLSVECYDDVPAIDLGSIVAYDNCQEVIVMAGDVIDGDECEATITRTYTVSDGCGNDTTHVQVINVNDDIAPVISDGPENLTVSCISEIPAADISLIVATDNCSMVTVTVDGSLEGDDCYAVMTRTYMATDDCGNNSYHVQVITVEDLIAPVITEGPADEDYQCVDDVPLASTNGIVASDNCGDAVSIVVEEGVVGDDCEQTITRSYTAVDACGNVSEPFVQTIMVNDDTAPVLVGVPEDIDVECGDDIPEAAQVMAEDNCAGYVDVEYSEINNAPENPPCVLETPFGNGGNWSIWLPQYAESLGGDVTTEWVFDANGGVFTEFNDGSATITGTVINSGDVSKSLVISIDLDDKKTWTEWHNGPNNGSYKDDYGYGADYYETWDYYVIQTSSTLVGVGDLAGTTLNLAHAPSNLYYALQVGQAANNNNANYGGGGWFTYTGTDASGNDLAGNGDVGFDADCSPCDYTILRTWTAVDDCGNEVSETQTINVTNSPDPELDEDVVSVPEAQAYAMLYTYPNPFTDKNNVEFELTTDAEVTLSMYNTDGKLVREMYQGEAKADQKYKFEFDAENLPTGVYIYKLITPTEIFVERVVLTR